MSAAREAPQALSDYEREATGVTTVKLYRVTRELLAALQVRNPEGGLARYWSQYTADQVIYHLLRAELARMNPGRLKQIEEARRR